MNDFAELDRIAREHRAYMGTDREGPPPDDDGPPPLPPLEAYENDRHVPKGAIMRDEADNPFLEAPGLKAPRFYPASSLDGKPVPPMDWAVQGMVPGRTVTMINGDGGAGKSLLALQLAHAVASQTRWIGQQTVSGRALFISAEDDEEELHRRLSDIVRATGGDFADLDQLTMCSLAGQDALLAMLDRTTGALAPTGLYRDIEARIAAEKPAVVVLDTLADLFPGNENDRAQARQFIGLLRGWAIRHDCAVILLAHPSLSGLSSGTGTSGSTAWNNSVRSRLYLKRLDQDGYEPDPDARVLSTKKSNYGRTGGEIAMTWKDGVFVPDARETGLDRMAATAKAERVFLKLLRIFNEQGRRVNANGGPTYAPKQFAENPDAEGLTKRALKGAMDTLFASGKIMNVTTGPASRSVTYLQVADA